MSCIEDGHVGEDAAGVSAIDTAAHPLPGLGSAVGRAGMLRQRVGAPLLPLRLVAAWAAVSGLGLLAACSPAPPPVGTGGGASVPAPAPAVATESPTAARTPAAATPVPSNGSNGTPPAEARSAVGAGASERSGAERGRGPDHRAGAGSGHRAPASPAANWEAYRRRAARRLVEANPGRSYLGPVHEPLLGIPVLQIELNGDGSVRTIVVLRHAQSARDTTRLAEDAVSRAAPFGDVTHLPKPWRYTETFLFDEHRRFKPRTLDE